MRIGIIASSSGGAFKAFYKIHKKNNKQHNFFILSDRQCAILDFAQENDIPHAIIEADTNKEFSKKAKEQFDSWGKVDFIVLFFTRLITKELFDVYPVYNLHPSLLPDFAGFNPIKRALESRVKEVGTTLHKIDESVDGGPIIAQMTLTLKGDETEESLQKVSFVHKVYLLTLLLELYENNSKQAQSINVGKNPKLKDNQLLNDIIELAKQNQPGAFK